MAPLGRIPDARIVDLNVSAVLLAEELIRLPSAAAAVRAVDLLWDGTAGSLPEALVAAAGHGMSLDAGPLALARPPLATLLPWRLPADLAKPPSDQTLGQARALGRARYRDLQAQLLRRPEPAASSIVGFTYGSGGRAWAWADAARRLAGRVAALNAAALRLAAAGAAGKTARLDPGWLAPAATTALAAMAAALPPLAAVDFSRLAGALAAPAADEATARHEALLAEILGLAAVREAAS